MAKLNTVIQLISGFRVLLGGVLLFIAVIGTLFVTFTVHGDNPKVPPPPTGSVHDTQSVLASDTVIAKAEQTEQQYADDVRNGKYGTPFPKDVTPPVPSPIATGNPPLSSGITGGPSLQAGWSSKYRITNEWYGLVSTTTVTIDVGSKADNSETATWNSPEQGIVIVNTMGVPGSIEYLTPTRTGQITITSYSDACLTLTSTAGTTYTFDAQSDRWSCSGSNP